MPSGDHSGWTIDSSGPPAARLASPRVPSGAKAATCRRVASHGMSGWSHSSQASIVPSGEMRGDETKSGPLTRTRGSPPSSGIVTIVLTGSPPPCVILADSDETAALEVGAEVGVAPRSLRCHRHRSHGARVEPVEPAIGEVREDDRATDRDERRHRRTRGRGSGR